MQVPRIKLNSGTDIPAIGLGTWQSQPGEVSSAVEYALQNGYSHVDGAWCYMNEAEVGQGLRSSGRDRKDVFLTSKLWSTFHRRVEEGINETLQSLDTDYLDLYLVHWPVALNPKGNHPAFPKLADGSRDRDAGRTIEDTWKDMEKLVETGKAKAIGVCNCSIANLEKILKVAKIVPAVNQVECHPYLPQHELLAFCQEKGITVQAYSPLGSTGSPLLKDEVITGIADKYTCSPATVMLSWQVARGVVVLPKSVTPSRIASNLKLVKLDVDDSKRIDELASVKGKKRFVAPDWGVDLGFDD